MPQITKSKKKFTFPYSIFEHHQRGQKFLSCFNGNHLFDEICYENCALKHTKDEENAPMRKLSENLAYHCISSLDDRDHIVEIHNDHKKLENCKNIL